MIPYDITKRLMQQQQFVSVVPTAQQMIKQNAQRLEKERRNSILQMSDEQLAEEIKKNIPLHETVKAFRDSIRNTYKDSQSFIFATQLLDENNTLVAFEWNGDKKSLGLALCQLLHQHPAAVEIFNAALLAFTRSTKSSEAERIITIYEDLINEMRQRNSLFGRINLLESEIKRLRKSGRTDLLRIRQEELDKLKAKKKRSDELRPLRLEWLRKGRETQAKKREKAKRAANNPPQPNFAKMAKQKRQQIAARKAEKKKKKSNGSCSDNIRSCSPMMMR